MAVDPPPGPATSPEATAHRIGPRPAPPPHPGRWRSVALAALVVAVLGGAPALRFMLPRPAERIPVRLGALDLTVSGPGTLDALRSSDLAPKIAGRLIAVPVARNAAVAAGQVVARLDDASLRAEVAQAEAGQNAARAAITQAKAALDQAEAARRKADDDLARSTALLARGVVGQSDHDTKAAAQAEAAAQVAQLSAALTVSMAQADKARAALNSARLQQDEATLRAPFSGIVTAQMRNPGDVVAAGTPILHLVDPTRLVLTARFDESLIATLHAGQSATLRFVSEPERAISGRVLRLDRSVDTETREFTVDISLDALPKNWAIGQRGDATIRIGTRPSVPSLPERALMRRDGQLGVWRVQNGRAHWQPVTTGAQGGDRVEIRDGLRAGDVVATAPRLFEGMRLRPGDGTDAP